VLDFYPAKSGKTPRAGRKRRGPVASLWSGAMADDEKHTEPASTPPGQFVSDDLRKETARFLDELRKRLNRKKSGSEPKLGPPTRRRR
jgi:hypothetical protein